MFKTGSSGWKNIYFFRLLLVLTIFEITACASTGSTTTEQNQGQPSTTESKNTDPYESFNRTMFSFNSGLDSYVAKPLSDAYIWVTPNFLKSGVSNFFSNLKEINVVLNDNMQGKFGQGAEDTGRFLANSTLGLLGMFDVASDLGLKKHDEDFGQTLGVWGVPSGSYLVLPLMGPTTARSASGSVFDLATNPSTYVGAAPVQAISMLNTRANADGALKFIDEASIDPYVFTREAYLQNLQHLVTDGKQSGRVDILPIEDDLFQDDENDKSREPKNPSVSTSEPPSKPNESVMSLNKANSELELSSEKLNQLLTTQKPYHKHKHRKKPH